ncbi:MAG: isocitrate/isopropylmalate dehydrogenase family protein [Nitrososphaerales archaeon]
MPTYKIAVIPGDGVGPEVISAGKKVLDAVSEAEAFEIEWVDYDLGSDKYLKTGELLTEETIKELKSFKAIYLGALGDPRVKPGILEVGILLNLRFALDQYVNLRPVKLLEGIDTPLKDKTPKDIDFFVVRENTEDFYIGLGGRLSKGTKREEHILKKEIYQTKFGLDIKTNAEEIAYQLGAVSREGARRVIDYAFALAEKKKREKVTSVDKANVLTNVYGLWRDVFDEVSRRYSNIKTEYALVDAVSMWFVKNPEWFEIVVTPNLFGDIITDLGAMIQGGMGVAPGGNINPNGTSMFEPIHGSAPKYKGQDRMNPIACVLAGAMLLEDLGLDKASKRVEDSVSQVLSQGKIRTYDLGGTSKTSEVATEIARVTAASPGS